MPRCSGMRSMTGCGVFGSNSRLLAPCSPHTLPGEFDHGALHPQADPEERDPLLAGEGDGRDLPLDPPGSRSPRAPGRPTRRGGAPSGPSRSIFSASTGLMVDLAVVGDAAVDDGLGQALVGVPQLQVLPDHGDGHAGAGIA